MESRQLLCDRFQHDDSCLVALLSITTANAGEWNEFPVIYRSKTFCIVVHIHIQFSGAPQQWCLTNRCQLMTIYMHMCVQGFLVYQELDFVGVLL